MAIFLKDLIENPNLLKDLRPEPRKPSQHEIDEDRYYEELGELIEQHPIVSAGVRRS